MNKRDWLETTLGEMVTFQRGFDITKKEQRPGPYAVISSSGPKSTHCEFKVKGPGVVIGRKGSLGTVFFSKNDFWPHDTTLWVKDFHGNDKKFAYYFLQTMYLEQYDAGASNPSLNRNHIHLIPILYPTLPTQRKIAAILSAYDDLIESNTRRIAILEQMARLLYREWFVHLRFPGHESVRMVESELGGIPEGWYIKYFSDVVDLLRNGIKPVEFEDEIFSHYSFPAFDSNCMPLQERGATIKSNKYIVEPNSVLLSKLNPRIPRVWLPFLDGKHRAIASTEFLVLKPKDHITSTFLFSLCRSPEFLSKFQGHSLGTSTSHQRVKPNDFLNLSTVLPPERLISSFTDLVSPITRITQTLRLKNANLHRARDLLLPRLISGELDVSELDIDVGEPDYVPDV
jgi:type I restriction enzyme S subunit